MASLDVVGVLGVPLTTNVLYQSASDGSADAVGGNVGNGRAPNPIYQPADAIARTAVTLVPSDPTAVPRFPNPIYTAAGDYAEIAETSVDGRGAREDEGNTYNAWGPGGGIIPATTVANDDDDGALYTNDAYGNVAGSTI